MNSEFIREHNITSSQILHRYPTEPSAHNTDISDEEGNLFTLSYSKIVIDNSVIHNLISDHISSSIIKFPIDLLFQLKKSTLKASSQLTVKREK